MSCYRGHACHVCWSPHCFAYVILFSFYTTYYLMSSCLSVLRPYCFVLSCRRWAGAWRLGDLPLDVSNMRHSVGCHNVHNHIHLYSSFYVGYRCALDCCLLSFIAIARPWALLSFHLFDGFVLLFLFPTQPRHHYLDISTDDVTYAFTTSS